MPVKKIPIDINDYKEILNTFESLDAGKIILNSDDFSFLHEYKFNELKNNEQSFLVSQQLLDAVFNDYDFNILSLMKKCNPNARVLKNDLLYGLSNSMRNYICYQHNSHLLSLTEIKKICFHLMMKIINSHIFTDGNKRIATISSFELLQNLIQKSVIINNQEFLAKVIFYYLDTNRKFPIEIAQNVYFDAIIV